MIIRHKIRQTNAQLMQIADALDLLRLSFCLGKRRKQQGGHNSL